MASTRDAGLYSDTRATVVTSGPILKMLHECSVMPMVSLPIKCYKFMMLGHYKPTLVFLRHDVLNVVVPFLLCCFVAAMAAMAVVAMKGTEANPVDITSFAWITTLIGTTMALSALVSSGAKEEERPVQWQRLTLQEYGRDLPVPGEVLNAIAEVESRFSDKNRVWIEELQINDFGQRRPLDADRLLLIELPDGSTCYLARFRS